MVKKRGLGRGLNALLGEASHPATAVEPAERPEGPQEEADGTGLRHLPVAQIVTSRYQPRQDFNAEALRELADSIAAQGVIQPVVVRPLEGGRFELIAGERRWRAARQAGLERIPAVIREVTDQAAMAMALIENIQRRDLNPLEEATALHRLLNEFALTHQQVAQAVGKSRSSVTNLLRVLELNEDVREHLERGRLDLGHAKVLLGLKGSQQSEAAHQVVLETLSVRATERLVQQLLEGGAAEKRVPRPEPIDPDVERLLNDLSERLGAKVALKQAEGGRGRLMISYNSLDELDGILSHIR